MFVEQPDASTPDSAPAPAAPAAPAPSMADAIGGALGLTDSPAPVADEPAAPEGAELEAAPAAGPARGPDGKFIKRDAAGNVVADPVAKPAVDPKAAAPKPDAKPGEQPKVDDDLTMPEGLTPKSQQRFQKLANTVKELTAYREQAEPMVQAAMEVQQILQENGVVQEQFERTMSYVGAFNRGDLREALRILDEEREAIAAMAGVELPGVDLLRHYPDLQQAVQQGQITRQHAAELASARRMEYERHVANEQTSSQQQQQQADQRARQEALAAIDKFLVSKKGDLNFEARSRALEGAIVRACQGLPPSVWPTVVAELYEAAGQMLPMASSPASTPAPLRPTGNANGARPRPTSMVDAIGGALGIG
jgi:hypothetical protein